MHINVIDIFAGPGGLGEGFSSLRSSKGDRVFEILMSAECDESAHRTLRLRAFTRKFDKGFLPQQYWDYVKQPTDANLQTMKDTFPEQWAQADKEAVLMRLSENDPAGVIEAKKRLKESGSKDCILIGGPPCQAYSLVGRSRRTNEKKELQADVKQTLYKCYLDFIDELQPQAFIMENVKGILSAKLNGRYVFDLIKSDMENAGYHLFSLSKKTVDGSLRASDYTVHSEEYGIPQARHRVILFGVRKDLRNEPSVLIKKPVVSVSEAIDDLPSVRSGLSGRSSAPNEEWHDYISKVALALGGDSECSDLEPEFRKIASGHLPSIQVSQTIMKKQNCVYSGWYRGALGDSRLILNHQSRNHMPKDLDRYLFCSVFAKKYSESPKLESFPDSLLPNHKNIFEGDKDSGYIFSDRFRVQLKDKPSTTITSHISKDGHYYIHYDPLQCRSLTVREAARLQTFPDDYFFEGNRTSQYQQVGNAVPPLLAHQIAHILAELLGVEASSFFD